MLLKTIIIISIFFLVSADLFDNQKWPVPYQRFANRPTNDPFCQAKYTFCPTGIEHGGMPIFDENDTIDVFALKAPVWEFKYGALLKKLNIMHDAIGFRSHKTKMNYTVEWYELDQLFNCTFPHVLNASKLTWCNQGASCLYPGIDDAHWLENGTLVKVAEMNGTQFKKYADYILWDNKTGIYYETWMVLNKIDGTTWFEPHDCATFVIDSFKKMADIGVKFNRSITLNYTMILIFSDTPMYLGNISTVKTNPKLYSQLIQFYNIFQVPHGIFQIIDHAMKFFLEVFIEKNFYFFYNYEYWYLPMKSPYFKLVYEEVPLP